METCFTELKLTFIPIHAYTSRYSHLEAKKTFPPLQQTGECDMPNAM